MSEKFRPGDAVEWNSHGGIAKGKVKKKLTSRTTIKGHQVASDPEGSDGGDANESGAQAAQLTQQPGVNRRPTGRAGP